MALEHSIDEAAFSELAEPVQAHYEKQGDSYFLQAVGMSPKSKVDEFRQSNIDLKKANEKFETDLADLQAKLEKASSGVDSDKVDALVEEKLKKRIEKLTADHEATVNELTEGKAKAETTLSSLLIDTAVQREAIAAGVLETAVDDVLTRANRVFKVVKGKAVPFDGDDPMYGKDGTTPLSVKDWLAEQAVVAPHLFKSSDGSGANNANKGGGAGSKQTLTSTQKIAQGLKEL